MRPTQFFVYIAASQSKVLYTGVTNDLKRRMSEHKRGLVAGFTKQYRVRRLVYFETCTYIRDAIAREKQIKGWTRAKRVALIESVNLPWIDLAEHWPMS
ncbi:MAG TPA: GIY-YIG nuclease family protein [Gemmatimonadales bacterium]|nr:GIY-YIG nuclease family protein [Gemmatimonadales bacterium]